MELHKTFNQEECTNIIINYIVNKKEKQALLIDGDWGSGKTFFINKFINDIGKISAERHKYLSKYKDKLLLSKEEVEIFKNKDIFPIISLYGLNSIDEIRFKLLKKYFPVLYKENKKINLGLEFLASNFINIIKIAKPEAKETLDSIKFENINKVIETLNLTKDKVIIFDDLERCNIEPNTLFGYINELIEEDNAKVILISNEKEIINSILYKKIEQKYLTIGYLIKNNTEINENKDGVFNLLQLKTATGERRQNELKEKSNINRNAAIDLTKLEEMNKLIFAEGKSYNKFKEKIIGSTIKFDSDIYKEFDNIVESYINDKDIIKTIKNLKVDIINILTANNFLNYRCLIFWLTKINKVFTFLKQINIYDICPDCIKELEQDIVKSSVFYAVQIKKNNRINYGEIDKVANIFLIGERKNLLGFSYTFPTLRNFILYGYFNPNTFKEEINIFVNIQEDKNSLESIVYKISGHYLLGSSKEELRENLNRILNRLQKNYERDIQSYNILFELLFKDLLDDELIEYALGKSKDEYIDNIVQLMIETLNQSKTTIRHINVITYITDNTYKEKIKLLNDTIDKINLRINKLEVNEKISKYVQEGDIANLRSFLYSNSKYNCLNSFDIDNIQQFIKDNIYIEGNNKNFGLFIYLISNLNDAYLYEMNEENINKHFSALTILLDKLNELTKIPIKDKIKKQGIMILIKNLEERKNTLHNHNNSKSIK